MGQKRKRAADGNQENAAHQHELQPEQEKLTPYELQRQRLCVLNVLSGLKCYDVLQTWFCCIPCTLKLCSLGNTNIPAT